jgi:O-antigen/teichoic acid export membrane protein
MNAVEARIKKNVGAFLFATAAASVLNLATSVVNARSLGAEGVGQIAFFSSFALTLSGIFSFSTQQPIVQLGKNALQIHDYASIKRIIFRAIAADYLGAVIGSAFGLLTITNFSGVLGLSHEQIDIGILYALVVAFSSVSSANGIFRLFDRVSFVALYPGILAVSLFISAVVLSIRDAPVKEYLISNALIQIICAQSFVAASLVHLRSRFAGMAAPEPQATPDTAPHFLKYVWTTTATGTITSVKLYGEPFLIGVILGDRYLGVFNIARQLVASINKITSSLSTAIFPELAELAARQAREDAIRISKQVIRTIFSLSVLILAFVALFGESILVLGFGNEFRAAYIPMIAMTAASLLMLASSPMSMMIQAFISPGVILRLYSYAFVVYIAIFVPLVRNFNLVGGAIAQLAYSSILFVCFQKLYRNEILDRS